MASVVTEVQLCGLVNLYNNGIINVLMFLYRTGSLILLTKSFGLWSWSETLYKHLKYVDILMKHHGR